MIALPLSGARAPLPGAASSFFGGASAGAGAGGGRVFRLARGLGRAGELVEPRLQSGEARRQPVDDILKLGRQCVDPIAQALQRGVIERGIGERLLHILERRPRGVEPRVEQIERGGLLGGDGRAGEEEGGEDEGR